MKGVFDPGSQKYGFSPPGAWRPNLLAFFKTAGVQNRDMDREHLDRTLLPTTPTARAAGGDCRRDRTSV